MDWTQLVSSDLLQIIGLGTGFLLPVLGMAFEEGDDAGDDVGDDLPDAGGEGGGEEPTDATPPEPFLKVNDRTIYNDADAARRGIDEKDRMIGEYRKYGTPQELAALRERAAIADKLGGLFKTGGKDEEDPLSHLNPEDRKKYEDFHRTYGAKLEREGYIRKDALPDYLKEQGYVTRDDVEAQNRQSEVERLVGSRLKETRGIEPTPTKIAGISGFFDAISRVDPQRAEALTSRWKAGDKNGVIDDILDEMGIQKVKSKPEGDRSAGSRDENGRFTRAELDERKRRTERLPKGPPQGGGAASEGDDGQKKRLTPLERVKRNQALLEEREQARQKVG